MTPYSPVCGLAENAFLVCPSANTHGLRAVFHETENTGHYGFREFRKLSVQSTFSCFTIHSLPPSFVSQYFGASLFPRMSLDFNLCSGWYFRQVYSGSLKRRRRYFYFFQSMNNERQATSFTIMSLTLGSQTLSIFLYFSDIEESSRGLWSLEIDGYVVHGTRSAWVRNFRSGHQILVISVPGDHLPVLCAGLGKVFDTGWLCHASMRLKYPSSPLKVYSTPATSNPPSS